MYDGIENSGFEAAVTDGAAVNGSAFEDVVGDAALSVEGVEGASVVDAAVVNSSPVGSVEDPIAQPATAIAAARNSPHTRFLAPTRSLVNA